MRFSAVLAAFAGLGIVLSACETGDESATPTPIATSTSSAKPSDSPSATPLSATPVPLGAVGAVDEAGFYVIEVSSGNVWRIDPSYAASGLWSPDGSAFARLGPERHDVDLVDLHTGFVLRIFNGGFWHASWSPDGRRMAFSTGEGLFTVRVDGTDLRMLGAIDGRAGMDWSPRGDLIASVERYDIRITDVTTGISRTLSLALGSGDYLALSGWVPDGTHLVLCAGRSTDSEQTRVSPGTYIVDVGDGSARKLADTCGIVAAPDGKSVVYKDGDRVFIAATDGSQPPHLLIEGYEPGVWSSDGSMLTLGRNPCETQDWNIYVLSLPTVEVTRVTDSPDALKESAGWSPNLNYLAYSAKLGDADHVLEILGSASLESRTLLTSSQHIHAPKWSPDGRYLSFSVGGGHGAC